MNKSFTTFSGKSTVKALLFPMEKVLEEGRKNNILIGFDPNYHPMIWEKDHDGIEYIKNIITETADKLIKESGLDIKYYVGTMIEIPRACLVADEIAKEAEFFSFGTNDLTQLTYGFSRDDAGKFLKFYYDKKIFEFDPFQKVDQIGVGKLMKMAIQDAKRTRPSIELGICGEHGGNPPTIEFCHNIGLTYVSCSPFRVPIARLAAAQAAVKEERGK